MDTATQILSTKAVLVGVTVRFWTAEKVNQDVTRQIDCNFGKYRNYLVDPAALKGYKQAATKIRDLVYRSSLAWTDRGLRILPTANQPSFERDLNDAIMVYNNEVDGFIGNYETLKEQAKGPRPDGLGEMYNEENYPTVADLRRKFAVELRMVPIPTASDFRCQMSHEALEGARKALEEANKAALREAAIEAWNQAREAVDTMAKKLLDYQPDRPGEKERGIFRDSLVHNVADIVARLPNLNISGDKRMSALVEKMDSELCNYTPDTLRKNDGIRTETMLYATKIVDEIDKILATI